MKIKLIVAAGLAVLSTGAFAQSYGLGGSVGLFFPSSSTIRNNIGSQFLTLGVTPWGGNSTKSGLSPEIDFIGGSGDGNSFFLVPVVLGYEKDFTSSYSSIPGQKSSVPFVPYARATAGFAYFDYDITVPSGANYSLRRVGTTAGLEAGLKISNSAKVFAKYNWFSEEQNFNFSGFQLGVVFSLFSL